MNKIGIFMNFWEKNWDADHIKYIKKASEIGFDVLELQAQPLLEMSKDRMTEIVKVANDCGIELTYSLGLDTKYDVSSPDEAVRLGGVKYLQDIIERIGFMGGTCLSGVGYAGWGTPSYIVDDKRPLVENSIKSMKEVIKAAESNGIIYSAEAVNRFEGCVINTAQEALDYVAAVDSPNIGVLLDTYHMNIEEKSLGDAIRLVGDKLTGFHTGDNNRTAPGRGHIDWDEVFSVLADINYTGRIVSEPFVMMGGEVGLDIKVWRDLVANPSEAAIDAEAKYLLDFEREMIKKHMK